MCLYQYCIRLLFKGGEYNLKKRQLLYRIIVVYINYLDLFLSVNVILIVVKIKEDFFLLLEEVFFLSFFILLISFQKGRK